MLSLCSCAHVSCMAVAETAFVLATMAGMRARCGRSWQGIFILGVFLAFLHALTGPIRAAGAAAAAAQPCGRPTVASRCARLGGTPGRASAALGVILAHHPPPCGGYGGRKNMHMVRCTFVARTCDSAAPA